MVLVIGVALVAALVARHSGNRAQVRTLTLVAGLALGVRLLAVTIIHYIAVQVHGEGTWLQDEASYFLATEALMPWPWDRTLPQGLEHLAGNGYLGLTTTISQMLGVVDSTAFRLANAAIGTFVVLLCVWLAQAFFGPRAGLLAGLTAAVWPDLVFWSGTFVRDTLVSFGVVGVWWALVSAAPGRRLSSACLVLLGLVLLATLREYLAAAVGLGVLAWLAYPFVRRQRPRVLIGVGLGVIALAGVLGVLQAQRIDAVTHELLYRQTVTRMETLGRLYRDPPPPGQLIQEPFRPGVAITLVDPNTGWLLPGLVVDSAEPGLVNVGLTDDTSRSVPIAQVELLQDARIPPLQLFTWVLPSLGSVLAGLPETGDPPNLAWIASALAWDMLLVLGILGAWRTRLAFRDWIFALCVIGGTLAALSAIPGAPGNAERHRATQTVPLLLVLASGLAVSSRKRPRTAPGPEASSPTSIPTRATTAVASSSRSER